MKIALISFNPEWEDKEKNKIDIQRQLGLLTNSNVTWVIFPEMTLTGFTMNIKECAEDFDNSSTIQFFRQCAIENKIYISFGLSINKNDKATNNLITISPNGDMVANYAKIHPFSYADENKYFVGGADFISANIDNVPVGFSICYDLRFPEMFQILSASNIIIVNIASWPEKRVTHWEALLQARAIENQVFFIGVNRTGIDGNNISYIKSSAVYDPEGNKLQTLQVSPEIDIVDINTGHVIQYRKSFPVKNDRKLKLYVTHYKE